MRAAWGVVAVCAPLAGCGYGLHQTAKTQPPGAVSLDTGLSFISNANLDAQQQEGPATLLHYGAEVGPLRLGLSDHADIGIGFLYLTGARIDAKFNVLPRSARLAVAPRVGAGYAVGADRKTALWMVGLIGSYDMTEVIVPYLAATFANHWFAGPQPSVQLGAGERLAPATGTGDGLLQLVAGWRYRADDHAALSLEYGLWLPMQNDPGTNFAFVVSHVVSVGCTICFSKRCE